jgi:hypothetical protein
VKLTYWRDLLVTGVVVGIVVSLLLQFGYDSVPPLPLFAGATLLLLAIIEYVFSFSVRARVEHRSGTRPLPSVTAVRALALAKASSVIGAIMAGAWLALLVYVLPRREHLAVGTGDLRSGVVGLVSAGALIAAGLWLERCLRTPEDPDRLDDGPSGRRTD